MDGEKKIFRKSVKFHFKQLSPSKEEFELLMIDGDVGEDVFFESGITRSTGNIYMRPGIDSFNQERYIYMYRGNAGNFAPSIVKIADMDVDKFIIWLSPLLDELKEHNLKSGLIPSLADDEEYATMRKGEKGFWDNGFIGNKFRARIRYDEDNDHHVFYMHEPRVYKDKPEWEGPSIQAGLKEMVKLAEHLNYFSEMMQ